MRKEETEDGKWISGEEYFDAELRREMPLLLFFDFLLIIYFLFQFKFFYPQAGWWLLPVILLILQNGLILWKVRYFKLQKKIPRQFIPWDSCKSRFALEPWRSIIKALEKNYISFSVCSEREKIEIEGKNIFLSTDITQSLRHAIKLNNKNIIVGHWRSVRGGISIHFSAEFQNWICVRFDKKDVCSPLLNKIKRLLKNLIESLPESNPFCRNCNKSQDATCYGPNFLDIRPAFVAELKEIIEKIDPYKDEETFTELVEKKKRLDGRFYSLEEFKKEFKKYIE